jgi:uncharacterized protein YegP (UPF0339 family)
MRFELYEDKAGGWRWRLVAKNGRIVADSGEGYKGQGNARRALKAFRKGCDDAKVLVVKERDHYELAS